MSEHAGPSILAALEAVIADRKNQPAARSYVSTLLHGGVPVIGSKVVEEASEVVEAGAEPGPSGRAHTIREAADLVFHLLVLLGYREIAWNEVESELASRFGVSGLDEKAGRAGS